ncbi:MAG: phosphate ABC transporter substrate-binding protein [Proteobacteria bacterium]|nr:phosphate ABC transporter substrate-binding protein [Pseudomonadota bacterium]
MHKILSTIFLLFVILPFTCYCNFNQGTTNKKHTVTIAGSTSVMPFTEKLAEHFMVDHPDHVIDIQGGGSTAGIQACMNNTVGIGMSSRQLKEQEMALKEIIICYDGISIVVHPKNPIRELTLKQVRDIFNGRTKNWKELGWVDRRIDAVSREEGSGTRGSFEELVMGSEEIDDSIMVQDSNGSIREVVATDPYAIGYISLGLVDSRVKGLSIGGVAPNLENIKNKKYKIIRPFIYVINGEPKGTAKTFIDFVLSGDGQKILIKEGLISIYD